MLLCSIDLVFLICAIKWHYKTVKTDKEKSFYKSKKQKSIRECIYAGLSVGFYKGRDILQFYHLTLFHNVAQKAFFLVQLVKV